MYIPTSYKYNIYIDKIKHKLKRPLFVPVRTRIQQRIETGPASLHFPGFIIWEFPKVGVHQNGWFMTENLIYKWMRTQETLTETLISSIIKVQFDKGSTGLRRSARARAPGPRRGAALAWDKRTPSSRCAPG